MLYTFAKNGKYCTLFANVYNVYHFLGVYNVNLGSEYDISLKCKITLQEQY